MKRSLWMGMILAIIISGCSFRNDDAIKAKADLDVAKAEIARLKAEAETAKVKLEAEVAKLKTDLETAKVELAKSQTNVAPTKNPKDPPPNSDGAKIPPGQDLAGKKRDEIKALVAQVKGGVDEYARRKAVKALGEINPETITEALVLKDITAELAYALKNGEPLVREAAKESVDKLEIPGWIHLLTKSGEADERARAAISLGNLELKARRAIPTLLTAQIEEKIGDVRNKIAEALAKIRMAEAKAFAEAIEHFQQKSLYAPEPKLPESTFFKYTVTCPDPNRPFSVAVVVHRGELEDDDLGRIAAGLPEETQGVYFKGEARKSIDQSVEKLGRLKSLKALRFERAQNGDPLWLAQKVALVVKGKKLDSFELLEIGNQQYPRSKLEDLGKKK